MTVENNAYNGYNPSSSSSTMGDGDAAKDEKPVAYGNPTLPDGFDSVFALQTGVDQVQASGAAEVKTPMPTPVASGGSGSGGVAVDTEAMRQVAKNFRSLAQTLEPTKTDVANIQVHAGGFPHGWDVNDKVKQVVTTLSGDSGFINNVIDKLNDSADDLEKQAANHENTEQGNGQTASNMGSKVGS